MAFQYLKRLQYPSYNYTLASTQKKMDRPSWCDLVKEECFNQVNRFYDSVLDSLMASYYKQNRYRQHAVDEDIIIQLEKVACQSTQKVKSKLKDPRLLFQASSKYREGKEEEDLQALEQKYFSDLSEDDYRRAFGRCKIEEKIKEQPEEADEDDDLASPQFFESTKTYHHAVKQEEEYSAQLKYQPKNEDCLSEQSFQANTFEKDPSEMDNTDLLSCRITGEYRYNTLKYKSKDLKYQIDFTNTFIKCPEGEIFCDVFTIETTKIDKDLVEDRIKNNR